MGGDERELRARELSQESIVDSGIGSKIPDKVLLPNNILCVVDKMGQKICPELIPWRRPVPCPIHFSCNMGIETYC